MTHNKIWSYSKLSSFDNCPYAWYLHYIEKDDSEEQNWYAVHGSLIHEILEAVANKNMSLSEASMYYAEHFDDNDELISGKIRDSTYEKCADFFSTYAYDYLKNDVIGAESHTFFNIESNKFHCYIDLLLQNKDKEYIVLDYKSSPYPFKKNNMDVLKSQEKIFNEHKKQLYLYAEAVKQNYGEYPKELSWLHFKDKKIATIHFLKAELDETVNWANETIDKIEKEREYKPNLDNYVMCNMLCGFRNSCLYKEFEDE